SRVNLASLPGAIAWPPCQRAEKPIGSFRSSGRILQETTPCVKAFPAAPRGLEKIRADRQKKPARTAIVLLRVGAYAPWIGFPPTCRVCPHVQLARPIDRPLADRPLDRPHRQRRHRPLLAIAEPGC